MYDGPCCIRLILACVPFWTSGRVDLVALCCPCTQCRCPFPSSASDMPATAPFRAVKRSSRNPRLCRTFALWTIGTVYVCREPTRSQRLQRGPRLSPSLSIFSTMASQDLEVRNLQRVRAIIRTWLTCLLPLCSGSWRRQYLYSHMERPKLPRWQRKADFAWP